MPEFLPISKSEASENFVSMKAYGKRALPNLDSILRLAELQRLLRPSVEEGDEVRLMVAQSADHIEHPTTKQEILKQPDKVNMDQFKAMQASAKIPWTDVRLTRADLPRLPDFSDDVEKNNKALAARADLANEIAGMGIFFVLDDADAIVKPTPTRAKR